MTPPATGKRRIEHTTMKAAERVRINESVFAPCRERRQHPSNANLQAAHADLSREFCDVDIGLGVGDNEATDTQRPLAAQTRLATVWSPLITTNIGRRRSVAGEEAVGVDEFDVASGAG